MNQRRAMEVRETGTLTEAEIQAIEAYDNAMINGRGISTLSNCYLPIFDNHNKFLHYFLYWRDNSKRKQNLNDCFKINAN